MLETQRETKHPRSTAVLAWRSALALTLLLSAMPAAAQDQVSCWADCGACWGYPWGWPTDCNYGGCAVTGETVGCQSGCCLEAGMASCFVFTGTHWYQIITQCGILAPPFVADDPEALKLYREAGACLDLGMTPSPRPDGHADWVLVEMDAADRPTAGDVRVRAGSSGFQALLPDLDPEVLALGTEKIRSEIDDASLVLGRSGLMIGIYPPTQSRPVRLDLSRLDGREVETESGEALFEVELTPKGLVRDVRALYWSDRRAFAALLPLLDGRLAFEIEDPEGQGLGLDASIHGLLYLIIGDGEVRSTLSYGYELIR